jgi:hydroxylamine reductase
MQDLLIYSLKGLSEVVIKGGLDVNQLGPANYELINSLFMTITNANFDDDAFERQIVKVMGLRDELAASVGVALGDAATFQVAGREAMLAKASGVGVLATENEDVRSLRELSSYGLKGMAAYTEHAYNLGKENPAIYAFMYEALAATLNDGLTADELVALTLKTGEYGVAAMALLDGANTGPLRQPGNHRSQHRCSRQSGDPDLRP